MSINAPTPPYRLELPTDFAIGPVNAYLFVEPEPTLIDCGVKTSACLAALEGHLAAHNLQLADIRHLVITHAHVDHMGLAGHIVAHSPATVWASDVTYPWLVDTHARWTERMAFMTGFLQHSGLSDERRAQVLDHLYTIPGLWDQLPAERVMAFPREGTLTMAGTEWQVLYTPGHSTTQGCFYRPNPPPFDPLNQQQDGASNRSGQCLAGDMLLHRAPVPVLEANLAGEGHQPGLHQMVESFHRLQELDLGWIYPGHGEPIADHRTLIARQLARIDHRKTQCYHLIGEGVDTLPALLDRMYSHYPPKARMGGFAMLVGYTDLLHAEGKITRVDDWRFVVC